jgi:hypothetical protein
MMEKWDLMGFYGIFMGCNGIYMMVTRPGKRTKSELEHHHAINGKIHYFDWAIFNSYVTNYQRLGNKH